MNGLDLKSGGRLNTQQKLYAICRVANSNQSPQMLKMLYATFLTLLIAFVSAQTSSIKSSSSSKCLEAGNLDIINGDPVRMFVKQDFYRQTMKLHLA